MAARANGATGFRFGAFLLIAVGIAALVYGKFSYSDQKDTARIGDMAISVQEHHTVSIPVWAGVGAIVVGSLLLLAPTRKWIV
jgi:uncharacterized membrane protein YidH (DUF202 family)